MSQISTKTRRSPVAFALLAAALFATASSFTAGIAKAEGLNAVTKSGVKVGRAIVDSNGDLVIAWATTIRPGMADFIRKAFAKYGRTARHVHLRIHSTGGSVMEGESVIQVLRKIRRTHRLRTYVPRAGKCYSMCVPIFLQGKDRVAARSSVFLFHDVSRRHAKGGVSYDREETVRLYQRYFVEAGVSIAWLNRVLPQIKQADFWQTGQELISSRTGIITHVLSNQTARR